MGDSAHRRNRDGRNVKAGQASQTAELVCMGRAVAHLARYTPEFQDPTALELLAPCSRLKVEQFLSDAPREGLRVALSHQHLDRLAKLMAARTVAIDDVVRETPVDQVVLLGAGLDGRAWRMPELHHTTVFEVDHPDSQREKRARVASLVPMAREVRFVPIDFTRDSLDHALAAAGHDALRPTLWIWEGVVMYLTREQIETALRLVHDRSSAGSRLCVLYHSPAAILWWVGFAVRRLGEPLRSAFTPRDMRALLERHGFAVRFDVDVHQAGARLSPVIADATRRLRHTRIVTAEALAVASTRR